MRKPKIKPFLVGLVTTVDLVIIMVSFTLTVFRDSLFDLYAKRLDAWVSSGADIKTVQSEVPETCGKLVLNTGRRIRADTASNFLP